jgi:hypothetical protein
MEEIRCRACNRPIHDKKWQKLGMGRICYGKWKNMVQLKLFEEKEDMNEVDNKTQVGIRQEDRVDI